MPTTSSEPAETAPDRRILWLGAALLMLGLLVTLVFAQAPAPMPVSEADETPFTARAERFADAPACHAWLGTAVAATTGAVAARGPYRIAADDTRAHRVRIASRGHEITEWRCLGAALSERSWTHALETGAEPFTMDDLNGMKF